MLATLFLVVTVGGIILAFNYMDKKYCSTHGLQSLGK